MKWYIRPYLKRDTLAIIFEFVGGIETMTLSVQSLWMTSSWRLWLNPSIFLCNRHKIVRTIMLTWTNKIRLDVELALFEIYLQVHWRQVQVKDTNKRLQNYSSKAFHHTILVNNKSLCIVLYNIFTNNFDDIFWMDLLWPREEMTSFEMGLNGLSLGGSMCLESAF